MSILQTHYHHFKLDFQKVDQHTGGKSIHGTIHHKDNRLYDVMAQLFLSCILFHLITPSNMSDICSYVVYEGVYLKRNLFYT